MADESPESPESQESAESEPVIIAPARRRRRWKWPLILLLVFVAVPALLLAAWTWIALTWTYSGGNRAGYVQKISRKGWLCKTWEGELSMVNVPGAAQERWLFSVRNDSVAHVIESSMGQKVALAYEEHKGLPTSCFGETQYFVTGVRRVAEP
jgi:hypothetical protein